MKTFNSIISEMFKIKEEEIDDNLSQKNIKEWDSMNYLLLVSSLESEFNFSFSMDQIMTISTIGDLRRIVESYK